MDNYKNGEKKSLCPILYLFRFDVYGPYIGELSMLMPIYSLM